MALISCPECQHRVSSEAKACPSCGYPIAEWDEPAPDATKTPTTDEVTEAVEKQEVLLEVRPSWWKFFWFLLFCWLIVPFIVAWYRRNSFLMRIYSDRVSVEEGVFGKEYSEFFIKDIRSIEVTQGFWARTANIGDILISTDATVDPVVEAVGVPSPNKIKELLIAQRQKSKG